MSIHGHTSLKKQVFNMLMALTGLLGWIWGSWKSLVDSVTVVRGGGAFVCLLSAINFAAGSQWVVSLFGTSFRKPLCDVRISKR